MSTEDTHRPYELHADCLENFKPTEVFSIEKQKSNLMIADDYLNVTRKALDTSVSTLPFFAERYNISADMKDYILTPVTIFLSGIPNKKGHCFDFEELVSADVHLGMLKYQTWINKPLQLDHKNKDVSIAKGILLASSMQPVPSMQGDLYKVIILTALDRRTYPDLGNKLLTGEYNSFSMGSTCKSFKCGVCGGAVPDDRCGHIDRGMLDGSGFTYKTFGSDKKVAYVRAQDIFGFETSLLTKSNPANPASFNQLDEVMRWED
jgi:hypothetical protein